MFLKWGKAIFDMPSQSLKYPLKSLFEPNNYFLIINPDKDHTLHWGASAKKKIYKTVLSDKWRPNKAGGHKHKKGFSTL